MREGLDAFLFTNEEEWLPTVEAILYIDMELGLKFTSIDINKLSKKHNLCRTINGKLEHRAEALKKKVEEVYFFEPPKGYITISKLKEKFPKVKKMTLRSWVKMVSTLKVAVGTTEVTYVKESEFRELYGKRTSPFWGPNRRIGKKSKKRQKK